ncbi:PTPA-CTERM sorting domain-containing protein [filamentous cyanobacterium LEGE 11480]|uniref:PTPA-CTERM sorting domain-containing protein n=1 Tax=Romeriopsis navalis LEGE 11480 TaxID=2777977 RepID=A0A928VPX2_9CYAN|nr:PTPA-CTERM sorting domain-containing protein [Romeriopsis navalis]MBE9030367.1 PTPA-CTERM sorting domain-containing protein [Romeriopsis navalis LEGE 11480]
MVISMTIKGRIYRYAVLPLAVLGALWSASEAQALSLFVDDRAGFNASLTLNSASTVVDSGGAFAPDEAAGTSLPSVTRTGAIAGQSLTYSIYDIDFSNTPTGTITPGTVGGDIAELDNLKIESPARQGNAEGTGTWGVDSAFGASSTRNAGLFDFDRPIGHFGLDLHDFESSAVGTLGQIRLYNNGNLLSGLTQNIVWSDDGNDVSHFIGVVAMNPSEFFDSIVFVLGDDDLGDQGFRESWAADRFTFGEASADVATPVPTPALLPGVVGLGASIWRKRRRTQQV